MMFLVERFIGLKDYPVGYLLSHRVNECKCVFLTELQITIKKIILSLFYLSNPYYL